MVVYSDYKKQRILQLYRGGLKPPTIAQRLKREGLRASPYGILKFLKKFSETGSIARRAGSGRPTKITPAMKALVDRKMEEDDETTATQIHALLLQNVCMHAG